MMDRRPYGDAVVTGGYGTAFGRKIFLFLAGSPPCSAGPLSEVFAEKIRKVMDLAVKYGCPVIGINDFWWARGSRRAWFRWPAMRDLLAQRAGVRGVIPADLRSLWGLCKAAAPCNYPRSLTSFMVEGSSCMYHQGPDVVKAVTGEVVTFGGARRRSDARESRAWPSVHGRRRGGPRLEDARVPARFSRRTTSISCRGRSRRIRVIARTRSWTR